MHNRLLPLAPPKPAFTDMIPRFGLNHLTLVSAPWLELGFFAVMIVGLMRFST